MERSKTGAECLYEQLDIHKFYAYVFNIWASLAALDPHYTIALNKTDQKSCSIRVNIRLYLVSNICDFSNFIYQWTDHGKIKGKTGLLHFQVTLIGPLL